MLIVVLHVPSLYSFYFFFGLGGGLFGVCGGVGVDILLKKIVEVVNGV